ncbi:hypothetical protein M9458_054975, partial [Cirrhinus mrigala]
TNNRPHSNRKERHRPSVVSKLMGRPLMSWRNRAHSPIPGRSLLDLIVYEADVLLTGRRRPD